MTATPNAPDPASDELGVDQLGGDPACWAHRVCQACGRLNEAERPVVCEACGAAFPDADPPEVTVRVCVPMTPGGDVDARWGRADRVAIADVVDGEVRAWEQHDVGWGTAHDTGTEGAHHARIASFLREHAVEAVAVDHVGAGMQRMLTTMGVRIVTGLSGDAHTAARTAGSS